MTLDSAHPLLPLLIAIVACVFASVGHGGASGYLAILSLTTLQTKSVAATALILNLVVATIAFIAFRQARYFSWNLTWPFLLGAAPFAFIGSKLHLSDRVYFILVGAVVLWAGLRLLLANTDAAIADVDQPPSRGMGLAVGSGIGMLSGMVGVGGGIFLSPIVVLSKWADAKRAAAASAIFIVSNSAIGLAARSSEGLALPPNFVGLIGGGAAGAILGSWIGARRMPVPWLRRLLGAVLLIAALKLLLTS